MAEPEIPSHQSNSFGEFIRTTRESRGISLDLLAERAGLDRSHLYKIETGRIARPRQETRHLLLETLGVPTLDVVPGDSTVEIVAKRLAQITQDETPPLKPVRLFFAYSHVDADLLAELREHLAPMIKQRRIEVWHDREIRPGQEWESEIIERLETADIIILLLSSSFIASNYAYDTEATRALERHLSDEAIVIPIVVRAVDWSETPLAILQALPEGALAVTSWPSRDEAWVSVAKGIRKSVDEAAKRRSKLAEKQQQISTHGSFPITDSDDDGDEPGMLEMFEDALTATIDIWSSLRRLDEVAIGFQRESAENKHMGPASGANSPAAAIVAARATFGRTAASLNRLSEALESETPILKSAWGKLRTVDALFTEMLPVDSEENRRQAESLVSAVPGLQGQFPGMVADLTQSREGLAKLRGYDRTLNKAVARSDRALREIIETLTEGQSVATHLQQKLSNRLGHS